MSDERNDRPNPDTSKSDTSASDTPPPLVPPPVFSSRADDTTAVSTPSADPVVQNDASRQAEIDRAAADARDLGVSTDETSARSTDDDAYPAVDQPPADAVEDHTVVRDAGDLEPEPASGTYPPAAADRDDVAFAPSAYETSRDEQTPDRAPDSAPLAGSTAQYDEPAETRAYDPVPVAAAGAAGAVATSRTPDASPTQGYETPGAFPPAPAQSRPFTPPPVEPTKKGNRGVGALIAVLSVIVFAVVYALIAALVIGSRTPQALGDTFVQFAANPVFFVPAIIFVIAFVIVVLLANRAGWWAYVLGSLLVAALVYFGTIGVALITSNVIAMTPQEATGRFAAYAADPFIVAAALVAREVSLWTGAAIASRGRRVKAKNVVARDEYERLAAEHRAEYERGYPTSA